LTDKNAIQTAVVQKAAKGDVDSKTWLYEQYSKAMYNICIRMAGNQTDADDILQEAFMSAFKNLHQLKEAVQFGGWLKRITVNECIKQCKKISSWIELNEDLNKQPELNENDWWEGVSLQQIHNEIKLLPNGCRQIFTLYAMEDYSHKQIAENLGVSESTSKSQYHRARTILKEKIKQQILVNG
jgi:RNA polymerase sigma factor (sigma-70 family)